MPRQAISALASDEHAGGADLVAAAERSVAPLEQLAPELAAAGETLRSAELSLREVASELRAFLDSLEAEPGRLEDVEADLDRIADLKRRYRARTFAELLERAERARQELEAIADGHDPVRAAAEALAAARADADRLHAALRESRREASPRFADAVAEELAGVGLGEGEFRVELREVDPGSSGPDEVMFYVRPNAGLPFGPVAETASGGELSAHRARDRGRRRRRDDGLRRDRRRDRRADSARRRRDASTSGGAGAGDHDHPPASDREPRRPPLSRREGARRPDAHDGSSRSAPTSGARSSSACSAAPTSWQRCANEGSVARAARVAPGCLGLSRRAEPPDRLVAGNGRCRAGPAWLCGPREVAGFEVEDRSCSRPRGSAPASGRASGPNPQTLVITAIASIRGWSWRLVPGRAPRSADGARRSSVRLRAPRRDRTLVTIGVSGKLRAWLADADERTARIAAVHRLYDLVQTRRDLLPGGSAVLPTPYDRFRGDSGEAAKVEFRGLSYGR